MGRTKRHLVTALMRGRDFSPVHTHTRTFSALAAGSCCFTDAYRKAGPRLKPQF